MRRRLRGLMAGAIAFGLVAAPWLARAEETAPSGGNAAGAAEAGVEASASSELAAELGVLRGDGQGVNDAYLAKSTTRMQAALLYLRLLGKEQEALADKGANTFADADKTGHSNRPVLSYLRGHPEYGWNGTGDGRFAPKDPVTAQQLYKVMLEALGYRSGTDFAYSDTLTFAASKGLRRAAAASPFTNRDLATALIETLRTQVKAGGKTLLAVLADAGAVSPEQTAKLDASRVDLAKAADGSLYMTDGDGMTLYLFTKDVADPNSCQGACLTNWPVFSADRLIVADGLDAADFGAFARSDGAKQLTYQGWPLYSFAKDAKPGEANGEGVGGVWFTLKQPFYTIGLGNKAELGNYLVDSQGNTLYAFDKDPVGASVCSGDCLAKWPTYHAESVAVPKGVNASDFGEIVRDDGAKQTTFKGYPLYTFIQDAKRGDTNGQGVGGVWTIVDPAKFEGTKTGLAQPAAVTIEMKDYAFQSPDITVKAGTPIAFVNRDADMKHNAVATNGAFAIPLLAEGESATITLTKPGVYEYYCEPHKSFMKGRITVQ